ncbi:uncharacterized protein [Henckelia pumila]|uniref:uncharacterized protein n=1 Tax=Henckelia pumila TaxID=405737 RepID=UPI003C6E23C9
MVHKTDLVIICISGGLTAGILIASLEFFGICWYKRHAHLRRCSNERSVAILPIRTNALGTWLLNTSSTTKCLIKPIFTLAIRRWLLMGLIEVQRCLSKRQLALFLCFSSWTCNRNNSSGEGLSSCSRSLEKSLQQQGS